MGKKGSQHWISKPLAARVIAVGAFKGDTYAAKAYGVTPRSIRNHRKKLDVDPELQDLVSQELAVLRSMWSQDDMGDLVDAVRQKAQEFLEVLDPKEINSDTLHALTTLLRQSSEIHMAGKLLEERLRLIHQGRQDYGRLPQHSKALPAEPGPVVTARLADEGDDG